MAEDLEQFSDGAVAVSADAVERAVQWVRSLRRDAPVSSTAVCEAVLAAMSDPLVRTSVGCSAGLIHLTSSLQVS